MAQSIPNPNLQLDNEIQALFTAYLPFEPIPAALLKRLTARIMAELVLTRPPNRAQRRTTLQRLAHWLRRLLPLTLCGGLAVIPLMALANVGQTNGYSNGHGIASWQLLSAATFLIAPTPELGRKSFAILKALVFGKLPPLRIHGPSWPLPLSAHLRAGDSLRMVEFSVKVATKPVVEPITQPITTTGADLHTAIITGIPFARQELATPTPESTLSAPATFTLSPTVASTPITAEPTGEPVALIVTPALVAKPSLPVELSPPLIVTPTPTETSSGTSSETPPETPSVTPVMTETATQPACTPQWVLLPKASPTPLSTATPDLALPTLPSPALPPVATVETTDTSPVPISTASPIPVPATEQPTTPP
jgi:hypothetical protein